MLRRIPSFAPFVNIEIVLHQSRSDARSRQPVYRAVNIPQSRTCPIRMSSEPKQYRLAPIEFGDDSSVVARFRRQLRNPSLLTFIVLSLIVVTIPILIVLPGFYSGARENLPYFTTEFSVPLIELRIAVPSNVVPYLRQRMTIMRNADEPLEWSGVSFQNGPCKASNLDELPEGKYAGAVADACSSLHVVQTEFSSYCDTLASCTVPAEAVERLDQIEDALMQVFIGAYARRTEEQTADP